MVWIFVTAVFLVTVFLAVRYRAFRRALLFILIGAAAIGAAGGTIAYLYDQQQEELSKTLIKVAELKFDGLTLSHSSSDYWNLKGNITNSSSHRLERFTLAIEVQNCPEGNERCVVVGEDEETVWIEVPPNQMRTFSGLVSLKNMPELKGWKWFYRVQEIRGKPL